MANLSQLVLWHCTYDVNLLYCSVVLLTLTVSLVCILEVEDCFKMLHWFYFHLVNYRFYFHLAKCWLGPALPQVCKHWGCCRSPGSWHTHMMMQRERKSCMFSVMLMLQQLKKRERRRRKGGGGVTEIWTCDHSPEWWLLVHLTTWEAGPQWSWSHAPFTSLSNSLTSVIFCMILLISKRGINHTLAA